MEPFFSSSNLTLLVDIYGSGFAVVVIDYLLKFALFILLPSGVRAWKLFNDTSFRLFESICKILIRRIQTKAIKTHPAYLFDVGNSFDRETASLRTSTTHLFKCPF